MTDFAALLRALASAGVEYILVGGAAATAHGAARLTLDLDVVYRRSDDNLERLARALAPYQPYLRGAPPGLPFVWDAATLRLRDRLLGSRQLRQFAHPTIVYIIYLIGRIVLEARIPPEHAECGTSSNPVQLPAHQRRHGSRGSPGAAQPPPDQRRGRAASSQPFSDGSNSLRCSSSAKRSVMPAM